jgi:hypothetical protein
MTIIVCRPKSLPLDKLAAAERRAVVLNPANEAERRSVARTPIGRPGGPKRIAVLVGRKWPASGVRLSVSFMDTPPQELRARILEHMNAWGKTANVVFSETQGAGEVRIARLDSPADMAGYWSYMGTEILEVDPSEPTLNLEGFTMKTRDAEFRRVVRHEAGHTLGFEHEHMRSDIVRKIDRKKAYAYFDRTEGWTPAEVDQQVLTPLAKKSIMGTTESDPLSIMCYQLPAQIMKTRKPIPGGTDINPKDAGFAAALYPKPAASLAAKTPSPAAPLSPPAAALTAGGPPSNDIIGDAFQIVILEQAGVTSREKSSDVAQVLATYGGARVISTLRLRAGKNGAATRFGKIIAMHERIRDYTNRDKGTLPNDEELLQFGQDLFETLFQGDVRRLYDEARVRERRRLDLVLTSMIPWIAEKPWEFAYDPSRRTFLATEDIHFVRNVLTNIPADLIPKSSGPLQILVAAAQPVGFGRLSIDQETAVIRRGFEPLVDAGLVNIEVLARATPSQIHGYLSTKPYQVVHFIGHGVYDEERREGCLMFETESGRAYPVGEREAREIFCGRGLSLVFLNSCESGRGGRADFNKGIAQSFVQHGLPAVVANQYTVLDSSATAFAQHFYWSIAQGMSLGQAAREARIAVNYAMRGEPIDWAIPVLYARDPNAALCTPPVARSRVPTTAVRPKSRQAIARRAARIAVWDMDDVFPALERTLETMNDAQQMFGFELVDLPVPLDTWEHDAKQGISYLRADRLARRLKTKPAELRVDVLACVTRHWLSDGKVQNLYGWWPDRKSPPIVIFSAAGFDELAPAGPETDRVIANAMVAGLAGFYGEADSHMRRSNCPLYFNRDRDYAHIAGPQKFDAQCRKALTKILADKLPALDALLEIFGG